MLIDHRSLEPSPDILKLHARCKKANRGRKKKKKKTISDTQNSPGGFSLAFKTSHGYAFRSCMFGLIVPLAGHQKSSSSVSSHSSAAAFVSFRIGIFARCSVSDSRVRSMMPGSILVITWPPDKILLRLRRLDFPLRECLLGMPLASSSLQRLRCLLVLLESDFLDPL